MFIEVKSQRDSATHPGRKEGHTLKIELLDTEFIL